MAEPTATAASKAAQSPLRDRLVTEIAAKRSVTRVMDDGYTSLFQATSAELADAVLGVVQPELDRLQASREKWATESTRQAGQIGDLRRQLAQAVSDLEAWDELRAQAHEQMRAGFAQAIRWKWGCETGAPDADMAADAVIDYLENEYAGQLARVTAERDQLRALLDTQSAAIDDKPCAEQVVHPAHTWEQGRREHRCSGDPADTNAKEA